MTHKSQDFFVTTDALSPNELWVNGGLGTFTSQSGNPAGGASDTYCASWADVNGNGKADLILGTDGAIIELWKNAVTTSFVAYGGNPTGLQTGRALAAAWADVDNDGDPDLFVANGYAASEDTPANEMWINNGFGTFVLASGNPTGGTAASSTAAWADIDGDGSQRSC